MLGSFIMLSLENGTFKNWEGRKNPLYTTFGFLWSLFWDLFLAGKSKNYVF